MRILSYIQITPAAIYYFTPYFTSAEIPAQVGHLFSKIGHRRVLIADGTGCAGGENSSLFRAMCALDMCHPYPWEF